MSGTVISNDRTVVYRSVFTTPDCKAASAPRLKILKNPSHGKVDFVPAQVYPSFSSNNPRSKCNDQAIDGIDVYYTPSDDYKGSDSFAIRESTSSEANVWDTTFDIKVLN